MTIYTKKGDAGETGLPGKRRLSKTDALFDCLGTLDQANASIGLAISTLPDQDLIFELQDIQRSLLAIGACLAAEQPTTLLILSQLPDLTSKLERKIDEWDQRLPELKNFILPGGTPTAASLQVARTIVRQAERSFHRLPAALRFEPISVYLNRLSDFFFQAARFVNFSAKVSEPVWKN